MRGLFSDTHHICSLHMQLRAACLNRKFYLINKAVTNHLISEVSKLASKSNKSKTRPYGFGSVYKRKKGKSWVIDFYGGNGKRIQKATHATNREQAIHALRQEVIKSFDMAKGIDVETVRELLGHHNIVITQRYTHSSDERKRKAVEILNKKSNKSGQDSDNLVTIENQSRLIS